MPENRLSPVMEIILKIMPLAILDDVAQWLAFGFNLLYVFLAARRNPWCWLWGFIGTIFQFIVCLDANLKSDAVLQVYYLFSAIYGWFSWREGDGTPHALQITSAPLSTHAKIIVAGILLAIPLGLYWKTAAFRYEDALLTAFSVITTFLTARKVLESWLYWVVIDASYAFIYFERDKPLLAVLSLVYFAFSIKGFLSWKKSLEPQLVA